MAVTIDQFVTRYPEFKEIVCDHRSMVLAVLEEAEREVSVTVLGAQADDLIKALAAQKLALSQFGRNAGLVDAKTGSTPFDKTIDMFRDRYGYAARLL